MRRNRWYGPLLSLSLLAFFGIGLGLSSIAQDEELPAYLRRKSQPVRIEAAPFELTKQPPQNGDLLRISSFGEGESRELRELNERLTGFEADFVGGRKVLYGFGYDFFDLQWRRDRSAEAVVFDVVGSFDTCMGERAVEILASESNVRLDDDVLVFDLSVVIHEREPQRERWIGRIGRMNDSIHSFVGGEIEER